MTMETTDPWEALGGSSTRPTRSLETRERTERKKVWTPPTMLPDPEPQDGYAFRWVRTETRGDADKTNFGKRYREGWEPIDAADYPELVADLGLPGASGKVEVGGLILCKIPQEIVDQRNAYYRNQNAAQIDAADNAYLRDSDERMKKVVERRSQTTFGRR